MTAESHPTRRYRCPYKTCDRVVGPCHNISEAKVALREHIAWRHLGVRQASFVDADYNDERLA